MKARKTFILLLILFIITATYFALYKPFYLWYLSPILILFIIGLSDVFQTKHTIKRNFPVIGNMRYLFEKIRPEIMQYFIENDTEGSPINRVFRTLVYERSLKVNDTIAFGTQSDVYEIGYEWMDHSIYAINHSDHNHKINIKVGGKDCKQPYNSSILNISAMSFGALSKNAVLAMNTGAKLGGFAHNTGEGGISPYHLEPGGDLIWQIGTGYFGCRTSNGKFCPTKFRENALIENVKMIEIKISQGAKPGHGGILPASKNTPEIAKIRNVTPHTDVLSPPAHSAFKSPEELLLFVKQLRELSDGKPIGFKLCIGKKEEFTDLCKAMISLNIKPDFISIDGGEGGTAAAPVEFSNSLGMPLIDGLAFAVNTLRGYNLKKDIKVIASGKVFSGFHIARLIALGADIIASARAIMLATGCIQALQCNNNTCPTGVATQNKALTKGLVVKDKAKRVANLHEETVKSFQELTAALGISNPSELNREHIKKRVDIDQVLTYKDIYPNIEIGSYL